MGAAASANAANPDFQETAKKSVATLTEFFDLQASMATGKVDEGKMAEFGAKLAGFIGASVSWDVGGNGGAHSGEGDFGAMIASVGSYWMGIENKAVKNTSISVDVENAGKVSFSQEYDAVVGGSPMTIPVTHAITLDENQKIVAWVQLLDTKAFEAAKGSAAPAPAALISSVNKLPVKEGSIDAITAIMASDAVAETIQGFEGFDGAECYALGDQAIVTHSRWTSAQAAEKSQGALSTLLKEHLSEHIAGPPEPQAKGPVAWEFGAVVPEIQAYRLMKLNFKAEEYDTALAKAQDKVPDFEAIDGLSSIRMIRASDTVVFVVAGYIAMEKLEAATPAIMAIMKDMAPHFSGPPESVGAVTRAWFSKK